MNEVHATESTEIGGSDARGWHFERFLLLVSPVIVGSGQDAFEYKEAGDVGFDVTITDAQGTPWLIVAKIYDPSTSARLHAVAASLTAAAKNVPTPAGVSPRLVLAIPGVLSEKRAKVLTDAGIILWDGPRLADAATNAGIEIPPGLGIRRFVKRGDTIADGYRRRLAGIVPGHDGWVAFQGWTTDVLEYLFCPQLETPLQEHSTENRHNRRDIILPNYAEDGFWYFMRGQYRADYVIVDAKNSRYELKKDTVLQLANYLSAHGTGLFGMVICRHGFDQGARWTVREHWVLHKKLIVCLTVNDMLQMLTAKEADNDPAVVIKQRIEDFRLGL